MAIARIERRTLSFQSLDDILRDAEQLAVSPQRTTGQWTCGQILHHLAKGADACFDGFGDNSFVPWWARWFIAPLMKKQFLNKTMRAGIKVPPEVTSLTPDPHISVAAALAELRRALGRFETETPTMPHPFLGRLKNKQEYIQLQLRHSELHLSFVHPEQPR